MSDTSADNAERIALIHRIAPREVVEALNTSDDPANDPLLTCQICKGSYYAEDATGAYEIPYTTPCGHVLGSTCLQQWARQPHPTIITCPICRFVMHFPDCGHLIAPRPAFNLQTPPKLTVGNVPNDCFQCEQENRFAVFQAELDGLRAEHEEFKRQLKQLLVEPVDDAIFPAVGLGGNGQHVLIPPPHPLPLEPRLNEAWNKVRDSFTLLEDATNRVRAEMTARETSCEELAQRGADFWRFEQAG